MNIEIRAAEIAQDYFEAKKIVNDPFQYLTTTRYERLGWTSAELNADPFPWIHKRYLNGWWAGYLAYEATHEAP